MFCRKLLVALVLVLFSTGAIAKWTKVDENDKFMKYADMSKIRTQGNIVKMWALTDFKTGQKNSSGKTYLSLGVIAEHDCENVLYRMIDFRGFTGHLGTGDIVFSEDTPNEKWKEITPGADIETEWKVACGTKVEWAELDKQNEPAPPPGIGKISKEFTLYTGTNKIRKKGNNVRMWTLTDFNAERSYMGKTYLSRRSLQEFDCENKRSRGIGIFWFSGNMGKLSIVASDNAYEEWSAVKPGSIGGSEWKVACGKK